MLDNPQILSGIPVNRSYSFLGASQQFPGLSCDTQVTCEETGRLGELETCFGWGLEAEDKGFDLYIAEAKSLARSPVSQCLQC